MEAIYRIKKVLNNNVVSATYGFQEVIVVGMGVGFNAKPHTKIDPSKIEKVFELKQDDLYKTSQLVKDIPEDRFYELFRLIDHVSKKLQLSLHSHSYTTLVDHINFAMERHQSGQVIRNMMLYDIKILYPECYEFGSLLLELVNNQYNVSLPEDEIGFITMHVVNGTLDINNQSNILTDMVFHCLNVVRDYYLIPLKMTELSTQRIMIHIKMLIQRVMSNKQVDFNEVLLYNVITEFESAYNCAQRIQKEIEDRLNKSINPQELVYLTIHLNRLEMMSRNK